MAYCDNCGAYIPDGYEKCLSCGYQPNKSENNTAQSATAQAKHTDGQWQDAGNYAGQGDSYEEQRRQRQEADRKWAEAEKQRREKAGAQEAQSRPARSYSTTRLFSILSYLSVLFLLPMVLTSDDGKAMFHARQGLRLFIFSLVSDFLSGIPVLGVLLNVGRIYFVIKGIINAANDRQEPLPYIGNLHL